MSEPFQPGVAPARALSWAQLAVGSVGGALALGGAMMAIGGWQQRIATLETQMVEVRENQKTYIPVLVGMQADMKYLADRARREDERRDREHP